MSYWSKSPDLHVVVNWVSFLCMAAIIKSQIHLLHVYLYVFSGRIPFSYL